MAREQKTKQAADVEWNGMHYSVIYHYSDGLFHIVKRWYSVKSCGYGMSEHRETIDKVQTLSLALGRLSAIHWG